MAGYLVILALVLWYETAKFRKEFKKTERKRRSFRRLHFKTVTKVVCFLVRLHSCFSSGGPKGKSGIRTLHFPKRGSSRLGEKHNKLYVKGGGGQANLSRGSL